MAKKEESFYRRTVPDLIKQLELMVKECLKIVGQKIDADLSDDKMHNVIKSKHMAAEESKWAALQIDELNAELSADPKKIEDKKATNYAEHLAK